MAGTQESAQSRVICVMPTSQVGEQCIDSGRLEACPLCGRMAELKQDHDHTTDLCRGRICRSCNLLVGRYDRPLDQIQRFLDYLAYWRAEHSSGRAQTYTDYMRQFAPRYRKQGPGRWQRAEV